MTHQMHGLARRFGLDELQQLVAQVRPIAGDGVGGVVAQTFDGQHAVAGGAPGVEQHTVGARREAVGVAEDDGAGTGGLADGLAGGLADRIAYRSTQTMRSEGLLILRMGS